MPFKSNANLPKVVEDGEGDDNHEISVISVPMREDGTESRFTVVGQPSRKDRNESIVSFKEPYTKKPRESISFQEPPKKNNRNLSVISFQEPDKIDRNESVISFKDPSYERTRSESISARKKSRAKSIISLFDFRSKQRSKSIVAFEEALKRIGFGRVQVKLSFIIAIILLTVLNETMGISFMMSAAECDLKLTSSDKGLLSGMTFFGIMVSSYPFGYLGDTQGRRSIILTSIFFSTTFTVISAFVKTFPIFVVCRFFTGVFVAGYSATSYAYIGEFNSNKNRGSIISWVSVSIGLASVYMPLCALWILSYEWRYELYEGFEFRPWRLLLLVYTLPGVIGGLCLYFMPESPKYLLTQGRDEEALEVVKWMYRTNNGTENQDNMRIRKLKSEVNVTNGKEYKGVKAIMKSLANQTLPLFKMPYLLYFFACSFLHFGTFSIAGGMALFLPDTLNQLAQAKKGENAESIGICDAIQAEKDFHTSNDTIVADFVCNDTVNSSVFIDSAYIGLGYLIGLIVLSLVIKPLGRRKIFVFTLLSSGSAGIILTLVTSHYLIIACYCAFILFCGLNVTIINGAACDLFPTHLRAMAVCCSMLFGRLGSTVSSNLIGYLLERNCALTYYIFSGLVFVCFGVSFLIPNSAVSTKKSNKSEAET